MSKRVNLNVVKFDGAGDKIMVINSSDRSKLSFGQAGATEKPFSISAWVFIADVSDDASASNFAGIADTGNNNHEYIFARTGQDELLLYLYDAGAAGGGVEGSLRRTTSGSPFLDSTWFHVVGTYDGSKSENGIKLYVNGAIAASNGEKVDTYTRMQSHNTTFSIGGYTSDNGYFEDKMADVCIFDKELTATEVVEIYNSGKVKNMAKATTYNNLISWWKMGDDRDASGPDGIKDYKGANHGTLQADAAIIAVPSLPTDRIRQEIFIPSSYGRTRQPKSVTSDHQVYIHGGISGNMPTALPALVTDGYPTENQRFLHMYWKATQTNKTHTIKAFGYKYSTGVWAPLKDLTGVDITLATTNAAVDGIFVYEAAAVDRVFFQQSNDALLATDLFAAAMCTF